jgi:hypothetical protein
MDRRRTEKKTRRNIVVLRGGSINTKFTNHSMTFNHQFQGHPIIPLDRYHSEVSILKNFHVKYLEEFFPLVMAIFVVCSGE